jgi:cyclohexa-1,5-dienecarbonyl-CoA hydratase
MVGGKCLGGGFELALACDQIHCLEEAEFGTPEIKLGCFPPAALVLMPRKLPALLSANLIQTGHNVRGGALKSLGVIAYSYGMAGIEPNVRLLAERFGGLPRGPLVIATRLLRAGAAERFLAAVGGIEQVYLEQLLQLHDAKEGPAAFLAKRKPAWDHT